LIPQFVAILLAAWLLHNFIPTLGWPEDLLFGALAYLLACRIMRALYARHHAEGIRAYQVRKFEIAVEHNLASYEFFDRHQLLDRLRHLVFGTASRNPYRTIALCNAGYCEVMRGNRDAATKYFVRALALTPGCRTAEMALAMLRSSELSGPTADA
jgi:hypothetical protein